MAWYPAAIRKNIPPGANDPKITVVGGIAHIAASNGDSLFNYFNGPSGGVESHFYIRKTGVVEQYRDTDWEADANRQGNSWIGAGGFRLGMVSWETEGLDDGSSWTPEQMQAQKDLIIWLDNTHGDFKKSKATAWNSGGVGYHVQFPEWTSGGRTCPGAVRIKQFNDVLVPWMTGSNKVTVNAGTVYIGYLRFGKNDSDSVKRMQEALNATSFPPYASIPVNGNYDSQTDTMVRKYQESIGDAPDRPGASSLGTKQSHKLFGPFPQVTLKEGVPSDSSGGGGGSGGGSITTPFPNARITTPYGKRGSWAAGFHTGDDFACPVGTPLRTMWTGRVVRINGWGAAYGTHVIIEFVTGGQTRQMAFCHMSSVSVRVGQTVRPGDNIGKSGNTGNTTGPHLHLEQRTAPFGYNNKCQKPVY